MFQIDFCPEVDEATQFACDLYDVSVMWASAIEQQCDHVQSLAKVVAHCVKGKLLVMTTLARSSLVLDAGGERELFSPRVSSRLVAW